MAGNPYTESGEKFQIPDMLANRADVHNLGDVLSGKEGAFALSYIENALTANPVLAPLAGREFSDVYNLVRMAEGEEVPASALRHGYSKAEQSELVSIFEKLFVARDVLLRVNAAYISSASQDDRFRTEPRFQLQGSYRNMAKLAQRIVGVMNDDELQALIDDHYMGEAQTLTSGAESNLLKLKELRGRLTAEEAARWTAIKKSFAKLQWAGGADDDPVTRVTKQISGLSGHVEGVRESIDSASERRSAKQEALLPAILELAAAVESVASSRSAATSSASAIKGMSAAQRKKLTKVRGMLDKVLAEAQTAGEDEPVTLPPGTIAQLWQAVKTLEDVD
ncbi:MAG: hypothetical protein A2341_10125 [Deltaproteobacteria bacterium RIFOXYB12_FULL_58_9]|nr:MAG: hypothetical protein A2341_10125 [Deltaproteobacteria bacterium RIFOXYB12_FULL_58_9]